ncbi:hypothetical protein BHE74_00018743 [Ensete ventricosum]|nr:hypothetical protein BHE74_00018743 [Ensete ventricosum]
MVFHSPSRIFKILVIPNVLAHGKSYEHSFMKKTMVINFAQSHTKSSFVSINFFIPSRKLKILVIPNMLARGKSYNRGFIKKRDGHKLCPKSCKVEF